MKHALALALVASAALAGAAHALDVYKWKDGKGVVHYGDRPASGVAATLLSVPDDGVSAQDEAAAYERLEKSREKLAEPTDDDEPVAVVRRSRKVVKLSCAQSWQVYDAAQACFDAHRVANGKGVSDAGLAVCPQVAQPACER